MGKTNYSVARVVTYTKQSIGKAERHNERKNTNYSNMNVDLEQTKNNVHYKTCNTTYNERLKELVATDKKQLKEKIEIFNKSISTTEPKEIAITSFVDKVKKYTEIKELTPEIINELIDKILVHQQTKVDGKKYQQIDIYYSGVGIISVSANEYDFEKEFQNILKNKRKPA